MNDDIKTTYTKPALIHYGSIKDVTKAGGSEVPDNKWDINTYSAGAGGYDESQ